MNLTIVVLSTLLMFAQAARAWTINAVAKGPNQINLTWSAAPSPGYGYLVEIQSDTDPRYLTFTELKPIPVASGYTCNPALNWVGHGTGCTTSDPSGTKVHNPSNNGVPTWVVEPHYVDPQDGTRAQFIVAGLRRGTIYNFRARTYVGMTSPSFSAYSTTATATTSDSYTVRYVTTTGNDLNDGTAIDDAHAWRSFSKASLAGCGVLVLVRAGDYTNEYFSMNQTCSPSSKGIIQGYYGDASPRVWTNLHPDWGGAATIAGTNNVMDGITFAEEQQSDYVVYLNGANGALLNSEVGPPDVPTAYGGVNVRGTQNLVYGCYIHDFGSPDMTQNPSGGGGFPIGLNLGASSNTIWSNHITRGGHDTGFMDNASYNKFLNNVQDGGWGMAFETEFGGSVHNLFEGTIARYQQALEVGAYKPAFELSFTDNVVRRGIFADLGKAIEISAYDSANNNLVYNNVFYNVDRCYFQSSRIDATQYTGIQVQNNICRFYGTQATEIYWGDPTPKAIAYNSIMKMGGTGSEAVVIWFQLGGGPPYTDLQTLSYADSNYGPAWNSNAVFSTVDDVFVDAANFDFHLKPATNLSGTGYHTVDSTWGLPVTSIDIGAFGLVSVPVGGGLRGGKVKTGGNTSIQ